MKRTLILLNTIDFRFPRRIRLIWTGISCLALIICFIFCTSGCKKDNISSAGYGTYSQSSGTVVENDQTLISSKDDLSAVKVTGGTFYLTTSNVSSSGNSSSADNSSLYGLNSVMLAYGESDSARINSSGNTISSTGTGATGIFAYGKALINSTGDKFTHSGVGAHAIMCSGGGAIKVINDTASTTGESSSTIATGKGGGNILIIGGKYSAAGSYSAAVYSTGTIICKNATLTATGAEALVIEGSNKIELNSCVLKSSYDRCGSMLYKSTSGDAAGVEGYLTMTGGSFTYTGKSGGMFYNTNSTAHYSLSGVTLSNSCDTLIRCIKGSLGGSLATSGGITYFSADGQTLAGLIHADTYSKAYITLKNSSSFTGAINKSNTANLVSLTMDYSSTWTLTASSYVNGTIVDPLISGSSVSNITGNGFNIFYRTSANPSLGGLVYSLVNGGQLIPD